MTKKTTYHPNYIISALSLNGVCGSISNRQFARHINVNESTVRKWRKEHEDFDRVFINAEIVIAEKVNNALFDGLTVREKITTIQEDGKEKIIIEQVLPASADILAFVKNGMRKPMAGFEEQRRRATLGGIRQRLMTGEITYLEAITECEDEGYAINESLKKIEKDRIFRMKKNKEIGVVETILLLESCGFDIPRILLLEAQKELAITDDSVLHPVTINFVGKEPDYKRDQHDDAFHKPKMSS